MVEKQQKVTTDEAVVMKDPVPVGVMADHRVFHLW